jgi:hypothetical protein
MRALALAAALWSAGGAAWADTGAILPPSDAWVTISTEELRARYDTLWAISDVHGRLGELEQLIVASGLCVNQAGRIAWNRERSRQILLVVGDLLNGGKESVGVVLLLERLQPEAAAAGSRLVVLMGNHEVEFLANPALASRTLLRSAWRAGLGPKKGLTGDQLAQSGIGDYLRKLPVAAFVGTWLFAHAGYIDVKDGVPAMQAYFAALSAAVVRPDYPALEQRKSILEYHNWWADKHKRKRMRRRLRTLGMNGLLFGHDPDALGVYGAMAIDRDGWLMKLDTGMKTGRSKGMLLKCEVAALVRGSELVMEEGGSPICRVLEPDGSLRALARE